MSLLRILVVGLVALTALAGASSQSTGPGTYPEASAEDYRDCYVRGGQYYDLSKVAHCSETRCPSTGRDDAELPDGLRWVPCPSFPQQIDD